MARVISRRLGTAGARRRLIRHALGLRVTALHSTVGKAKGRITPAEIFWQHLAPDGRR